MKFLRTRLGSNSEVLGFFLITFFFLIATRLWPSVAGRIGHNVGASIFVLAIPLVALISVFMLWNGSRNTHRGPRVSLIAIALVAWAFVSSLWATDLGISIDSSITLLSVLVFGLMAGTLIRVQTIQLSIIFSGYIGLAASLALWVLVPSVALQFPGEGITGGLAGIYLHKNYFGLVMALSAVAALSLTRTKTWQRILLALPFVVGCGLSASASAVGGMAGGIGVIVVLSMATLVTGPLRRTLGYVIAGTVAALVTIFVVSPQSLVSVVGRTTDFTGRTPIWTAVLHWIQQRPVVGYGWGIDNVWFPGSQLRDYVSGSVGFGVSHSHNSALELLLQVGVVGLLLVAAALVSLIILSLKMWNDDNARRGEYAWILATTIGLVVIGYFEVALVQERGLFLVFVFLTLVGSRLSSGTKTITALYVEVGRPFRTARVDV